MSWLEVLKRDGVARIEEVFTKGEMDELRCLCWRAFRSAKDSEIQWKGLFPALLFCGDQLNKFRKDGRLAEIASKALGPNILQLNNQVYFRLPGDGDQFSWHQDISFRIPKDHYQQIETGYLQTAIVIDQMLEENSPIEFVLGSHEQGDLDLIPRDGTERGLRRYDPAEFSSVAAKSLALPGDVLVWSVMSVHGSQPNQSNLSRMYYMNGFAKSETVIKGREQWPRYMEGGTIL